MIYKWQERSCILWFIQILDDKFFTQFCGELEPKLKKLHEKESTLQPKEKMNLTILVFYPSGGGYNVIGATVFS